MEGAWYGLVRAWRAAPWSFALTLGLNLALSALPAAQILLLQWVTTALDSGENVAVALIALGVTVGVAQVAGDLGGFVTERITSEVYLQEQRTMLKAVCRLTPDRLATEETNAELQACRDSLDQVAGHSFAVVTGLRSILAAIGVCAAVMHIDAIAGILVVLAVVPLLMVASWAARVLDAGWASIGAENRHVGYGSEQSVSQRTGTELATLGSGERLVGMVTEHQRRRNKLKNSMMARLLRGNVLGAATTSLLLCGALAFLVRAGSGAGGVAVGVVAVLSGVQATAAAGDALARLVQTAPMITRYREFLASVPEATPQAIVHSVGILEVEDVTVVYEGAESAAVSGASLKVAHGQMIAFVGMNGAGKTTLVNAILGVVPTRTGGVAVDGVDLATLAPQARLSLFGLLSQEFGRYEFTVREAVLLGTPDASVSDDRVRQALEAAQLGAFVRGMPDGLDTQLGQQWGGVGLSGGQWQRLALARIHLRAPAIWVLDEPTSAIDAVAEEEIFDELYRQRAERLTIVVSHRAWTLRKMDAIYVFRDGHIVEVGSFDDLVAGDGEFVRMFRAQLTGGWQPQGLSASR